MLWSRDFNAHHTSWDENSEEDALEEAQVEMMADDSLATLNDGKGTWGGGGMGLPGYQCA